MSGPVNVRPLALGDEARWRELYAGYASFYRVEQTPEMAQTVWRWLFDEAHPLTGLVAHDEAGRVQGIAHYREFPRPLRATVGCFLDDLYVDPDARGGGFADALLTELRRLGGERGWANVRWITSEHNYRARAKYDQYAERTAWVTYDMAPSES